MFRKTLVLGLLVACAFAQDGIDDAFDEAEDAAAEAADDFGEDAEDALADAEDTARDASADDFVNEAETVAAEVEEPAAPKTVAEEMREEAFWTLMVGIDSIWCTLMWFLFGWFVYIKTNT